MRSESCTDGRIFWSGASYVDFQTLCKFEAGQELSMPTYKQFRSPLQGTLSPSPSSTFDVVRALFMTLTKQGFTIRLLL